MIQFWFIDTAPAAGVYKDVLHPAVSKCDICYWINKQLQDANNDQYMCINTAVEETMLRQHPLRQDLFVSDNVQENDVLVVSIGGNDIGLQPTFMTILNLALLVMCASKSAIDEGSAFGFCHLKKLFGQKTKEYIEGVLRNRTKPKKIIVCMLYFIDENTKEPSWASTILSLIGYNSNPTR